MNAVTLIIGIAAALLTGCKSSVPALTAPEAKADTETAVEAPQPYAVPYTIAQGYFVRNDVDRLSLNRIISREQFDLLFGMATVMGGNGKPTPIDFNRQIVIAVDAPVTDRITTIVPVSLEFVPASQNPTDSRAKIVAGSNLSFTYKVQIGSSQSFSTHPVLIIVVDRRYDAPVALHRLTDFLSY